MKNTLKKLTCKQIYEALQQYNLVKNYSKEFDMSKLSIEHLSYNTNDVVKNTLFFCKGLKFKVEYLLDAIKNGTVMYIAEKVYTAVNNTPYIIVEDVKKAMAVIAKLLYDTDRRNFKLVGVTGTKGKTTTCQFLKNIFDEYTNKNAALISTTTISTGITETKNTLTTPESLDIHKYFYEANVSNKKIMTMEVSSQGYKVDRLYSIKFDIGMFLNISEDHISPVEHSSFEDYLDCKIMLLKNSDIIVLNKDMNFYDYILNSVKSKDLEKIYTFSMTKEADYYITDIKKNGKENGEYTFIVKSDRFNYEKTFVTTMQGVFNVENALAAITVAKIMNIDDESIKKGIKKTNILGRMTVFNAGNITSIVDYAHNKISFLKLYESIKKEYPDSNIISIFGCPGNKAYNRRKDLGEVSAINSDMIYLTADDPQYETVRDISNDISTYIKPYNTEYEIIEDRKEAIKKAFEKATTFKNHTVIVLAGKGAEDTQKIQGRLEKYESDIEIVKAMINNSNQKNI